MRGAGEEFTPDMVIQYSIVGLILLAVCFWLIWKLHRKSKQKDRGGCCGCSLSETCNKKNIKERKIQK